MKFSIEDKILVDLSWELYGINFRFWECFEIPIELHYCAYHYSTRIEKIFFDYDDQYTYFMGCPSRRSNAAFNKNLHILFQVLLISWWTLQNASRKRNLLPLTHKIKFAIIYFLKAEGVVDGDTYFEPSNRDEQTDGHLCTVKRRKEDDNHLIWN